MEKTMVDDLIGVFSEPGIMERSQGKAEIEEMVRRFIDANLEIMDSGTLYIYLKQLEYGIKVGIENLTEQAFEALGYQLGGSTCGKFLGHDIILAYPQEWHYSPAVDSLKNQQKQALVILQDQEKAAGIAKQIPGKARLTVTLKES
jgi:hypothetical protein